MFMLIMVLLTELLHFYNLVLNNDVKTWGYAEPIFTHRRCHHVADKRKEHHPDEQGDSKDSDHREN